MVSHVKPPVDLSIAVRKHHDPTVESQVCVICPRRKGKPAEGANGASPVALSLEFLRPLFKKPLTQVSEELGLSATAIKKACRRFGVPKWPFRTLTAKTSRNRTTFDIPAPKPQHGGQFAQAMQMPPKFGHHVGMAPGNESATRDNDDLRKLQEDAEMIKEVAALAEAREAGKKGGSAANTSTSFDDQELSAAQNLHLLSASAGAQDLAKMDLGELQMQYIRAWQQQQAALSEGALPKLALSEIKTENGETIPQLPSLSSHLILPPPTPLLAYPAGLQQGGTVLCPVNIASLPFMGAHFQMAAFPAGLNLQMFMPATALQATAMPLSS